MEVKKGKDFIEAAHQIDEDERLESIAHVDPDAILLHDPEGSVITSIGGNGCYENIEDFLKHRLKANHGSLDRLCKEIDYDPYEFIEFLVFDSSDIDELVNDAYDGERLGDIYAR